MPKNDAPTPCRRGLLLTAVAAAPLAVPAGAVVAGAAAQGADAELIALCAEWRRAVAHEATVHASLSETPDRDLSAEQRAMRDGAGDALIEIEDLIFGTEAATLAGVKAKAGILYHMDERMGLAAAPEHAASLVADVLALGATA